MAGKLPKIATPGKILEKLTRLGASGGTDGSETKGSGRANPLLVGARLALAEAFGLWRRLAEESLDGGAVVRDDYGEIKKFISLQPKIARGVLLGQVPDGLLGDFG
ncbi:MAG: hypothetical protein LBR11_06655 [Deltaproteobacteria bacterium]|jgi:hypothetical protein|nr:hypothetical protein [Deltaproteobacteria bacterium]